MNINPYLNLLKTQWTKWLEIISEQENLVVVPQRKRMLLRITMAMVLLFFIWSYLALIDEVTRGEGKVIPSSQVQLIQNLEGGIVQKIEVKEGQIVKKGQILMQLDPTRFQASFKEAQAKQMALKLQLARLTDEINQKSFTIPTHLPDEYQEQADQQQKLFQNRQQELAQLKESYQLAVKELKLNQPLVTKGAVSPAELIRLERTASDLKSQVLKYQSDTLKELNETRAQLTALEENLRTEQDRVDRTTVRSPVNGIVKQIKITTIGGVAQPGNELMEIVPLDDSLLIEAKILPKDIGFIHIGQKATVKVAAYDSSIYGGLEGTVEQISADAIQDEKKPDQTYYLIRIRTQQNYLGTKEKPLYIIPGMTATVEILTGKKSVLHYLLKPLIKTADNALTER